MVENARELDAEDIGVVAILELVHGPVPPLAFELLVENLAPGGEPVEADRALGPAWTGEPAHDASEGQEERPIDGPAERRFRERRPPEEALA